MTTFQQAFDASTSPKHPFWVEQAILSGIDVTDESSSASYLDSNVTVIIDAISPVEDMAGMKAFAKEYAGTVQMLKALGRWSDLAETFATVQSRIS